MNPFPNCYSHYMDTLVLANWAGASLLIYHRKAIGCGVLLGSCFGPLAYLVIFHDLTLIVLSSFSSVYLLRLILLL